MVTVTTATPSHKSVGATLRGVRGQLHTEVKYHKLSTAAEGTKEDIDFRSGLGQSQCAWMFRNGNIDGLDSDYGNINWSVGMWDGVNHASACQMLDPEILNSGSVEGRRAHTMLGAAVRSQLSSGGGARDLDEVYDFTDVSGDTLELNNLVNGSTDECDSFIIPFTEGVENSQVGEIAIGTGAGTVDIPLDFEADLILVTSISRTTAPSVDDAVVAPNGPVHEATSRWCVGIAVNKVSTAQRCLQFYHKDDKVGPAVTSEPMFQIRNDCVACDGDASLNWDAEVTDWQAGGGTDIEITHSAGSAGEYLLYHAIKFVSGTEFELVDTNMPAVGDWEVTGLGFKPTMGINFFAANVSALNTLTYDDMIIGTVMFDHLNCYSQSLSMEDNVTFSDGTGTAATANDIAMVQTISSVDSNYAEFGAPQFGGDGLVAPVVASPASDILGFLIVFGE